MDQVGDASEGGEVFSRAFRNCLLGWLSWDNGVLCSLLLVLTQSQVRCDSPFSSFRFPEALEPAPFLCGARGTSWEFLSPAQRVEGTGAVVSLWRNRLARSAVNRKVGGSSPPRDGGVRF